MAKPFEIVWDDFSGGHFFGNRDTKQPKNTWTGLDVIQCAADGFLMPGSPLVEYLSGVGGLSNELLAHFGYLADGGTGLRYGQQTTVAKTFVVDGDGSSPYALGAESPRGWPIQFNGQTLQPLASAKIILYNGAAVSTPAVPAAFTGGMYAWDAWALGVAGNRIYFCAPLDATSWNSNDYLDVGDSDATIRTVVPTVHGILVGTARGWWEISGVLGQTTVQRRLTTKGVAAAGGVEVDAGVFFAAGNAPAQGVVRLLSGTQTPTVLWDKNGALSESTRIAKVAGQYVFVACGADDQLYMWSEHTRNWRLISLPSYSTLGWGSKPQCRVATDNNAAATVANVALTGSTITTSYGAYKIYTYDIDPAAPPESAGAYVSATARLSNYDHDKPFRVNEVIVELDLAATSTNATRSIGLQVEAPSPLVERSTDVAMLANRASALQTYTLPEMDSTSYQRPVVRFSLGDTGDTYSITPALTMQGVKVRRVIARCVEAG